MQVRITANERIKTMTMPSKRQSFATSSSSEPPARSMEDFHGDYGEVALMMQQSWSENSKQPLLYTAEFLESCFQYPGSKFYLAPTIYEESKPVAFVAGFPRYVRLRRRALRILIITFLSVAAPYKKKGYGVILWSELVTRAKAVGFDGMVNYCVKGEPMDYMIEGCCRRLGLPVARAYSVHYLSALLWPKKPCEAEKMGDEEIVEGFLRAAAPIAEQTPLSRIWSYEEAEWQCLRRIGSIVAQHKVGLRHGIVTGYVMQIANPERTRCLIIEDLLWGTLEKQEREILVRKFLAQAAGAGAQMAIVPILGYAEIEPFLTMRFRFSQRIMHAYFTVWKEEPVNEVFPSIYLDVF